MGLFGNKETKEDKEQKQVQEFLNKYQLDNIDDKDLVIIKRIANNLAGAGLMKAGLALSFAKAEEQAKVAYLSALVEQNWMLIRKLDEISNKLDNK